jgi:hypothetical protein
MKRTDNRRPVDDGYRQERHRSTSDEARERQQTAPIWGPIVIRLLPRTTPAHRF